MEVLKVGMTNRGFEIIEFDDRYGVACHLQKSSLATEDAIWFGCDEPDPRVLVPGKGWQPAVMPPEWLTNTCMHLTQEQVRSLLPYLVKFVETGELL